MQTSDRSLKTIKFAPSIRKERRVEWNDRLAIYFRERIELIEFENIVYLKSDSNYCYIHLSNGRKLLTSQTLKYFSERLDLDMFMRTHQSYIVRNTCIQTFFYGDQSLLLSDGSFVPVSRTQKETVLRFFAGFKRNI